MNTDYPMPTENRSSNTEMVSVPRSLIQSASREPSGEVINVSRRHALETLRELLSKPAPEPHAEPIAWMVGTAFWWTKEEAERDAKATGLPMVAIGPVADSGEVDRLRAELVDSDRAFVRASTEAEHLRAKLAERDTLLHKLEETLQREYWDEYAGLDETRELIDAALSASQEPSTPAAPYPNRLCHIDYTAHPYRCGCLKGDEEAQRRYDEHCRAASAEPETKS